MLIGEQWWQISLSGEDWKKSIHADDAQVLEPAEADVELVDDARRLQQHFALETAGVDYMIARDGSRHLMEVNHIPNVDRFGVVREAYLAYAAAWLATNGVPLAKGAALD